MENTDQQPSRKADRSKIILLVVHDLKYGFNLITTILQKTHYEAFVATERYQALDFLKVIKPSLFVLDYQLPGINGLELYDQLHTMEALKGIPALILMDGDPRLEHQIRQRKLESLRKPSKPDDLIPSIKQLLA